MTSSYISINKLIESFKSNGLIKDDDKQLNIFFDNWNKSTVYKNTYSIRVLSFVVIGENARKISFKDFHEILPDVQNINIGKQISRDMRKIKTANCRCILVNLNQVNGKDYTYYPLKLSTKDYSDYYVKLREERSEFINSGKPDFIEDIDAW